MKKYTTYIAIVVFALSFLVSTSVQAVEVNVSTGASVNANSNSNNSQVSGNASTTVEGKTNSGKNNEDDKDKNSKSSSTKNNQGSTTVQSNNGAEHRSAVAAFVQGLVHVADREGGIGAEVRMIAQEQNESASTTVHAMSTIESRSGVAKFFFGTDYKNTEVIRSEIAKTEKRIEKLKELAAKATTVEGKAELNAQIKVLEEEQVKLEAFVEAHEDEFSLFGWFVKMF